MNNQSCKPGASTMVDVNASPDVMHDRDAALEEQIEARPVKSEFARDTRWP